MNCLHLYLDDCLASMRYQCHLPSLPTVKWQSCWWQTSPWWFAYLQAWSGAWCHYLVQHQFTEATHHAQRACNEIRTDAHNSVDISGSYHSSTCTDSCTHCIGVSVGSADTSFADTGSLGCALPVQLLFSCLLVEADTCLPHTHTVP